MRTFDVHLKRPSNDVHGGRSHNLSNFESVSLSSRFAILLSLYSCCGGLLGNERLSRSVNVPSVPCSKLSVPQSDDKEKKEITSTR